MGIKRIQKVDLKKLGFLLITISILILITTSKGIAAPSPDEMKEGLFGKEGVLWQAVNWAKGYIISASGLLMGVGLARYFLDSVKNN